MKKILILLMLTFGLYPVIENGNIQLTANRVMAQSWGDEDDWWDDEEVIDMTNPYLELYDQLSDLFGMPIVDSDFWLGHTVFILDDGTIWDPSLGSLDWIVITGYKEEIINAWPNIIDPDEPEYDPDFWDSIDELLDYIKDKVDEQNEDGPVCPPSVEDLEKAFPTASEEDLQLLHDVLDAEMGSFGINTKEELRHFLAQAGHESGGFRNLNAVESFYFSPERLVIVWPNRFSFTDPTKKDPNDYAYNPEKLANFVYGTRNGNNQPGDALKYKGRGIIQLTGRGNYQAFQDWYNDNMLDEIDIVNHPEILETDAWLSVEAALWFYMDRVLDRMTVDSSTTVEAVTKRVNGGKVGLPDREAKYKNVKKHIDCN